MSPGDEYAKYTEDGSVYVRNVDRLSKKWETAKTLMPDVEVRKVSDNSSMAIVFYGTSSYAASEASDILSAQNVSIDSINIKAFPFKDSLKDTLLSYDKVFVIDQNRDAQMRSLLINELEINPAHLSSILSYDGMPITADLICNQVLNLISVKETI